MKLNNKGFGMRETICYLTILLSLLLFASFSISSFYDSMYVPDDKEDGYIKEDVVIKEDEDDEIPVVVNKSYYYDEENRFEDAVYDYVNDNNITNSLITLYLSDLEKGGYLTSSIVDYVDGSKCSGYANVSYNGAYEVDVYLMCSNYKTEGYR